MNLKDYAETWVRTRGLLDEDSDYNGMLGEGLLKLIETFREEGHSGYSASLTKEMFYRLLNDFQSGQEADYRKAKPVETKTTEVPYKAKLEEPKIEWRTKTYMFFLIARNNIVRFLDWQLNLIHKFINWI